MANDTRDEPRIDSSFNEAVLNFTYRRFDRRAMHLEILEILAEVVGFEST